MNRRAPLNLAELGHTLKLLISPSTHKSLFTLHGTWEAVDGCKILPCGVGIISPLAESFLGNVFSGDTSSYMLKTRLLQQSSYVYMYRPELCYQNVHTDRYIISRLRGNDSFPWRNVTPSMFKVDFPLFKLMYN